MFTPIDPENPQKRDEIHQDNCREADRQERLNQEFNDYYTKIATDPEPAKRPKPSRTGLGVWR
jgi:hypothetical protein